MLKVGRHYINESVITSVYQFSSEELLVGFAGDDDVLVLNGRDREAVVRWLDNVSVHLDAATDEERAYAEYCGKGGEMPKAEWLDIRARYEQVLGPAPGGLPWPQAEVWRLKSLLHL